MSTETFFFFKISKIRTAVFSVSFDFFSKRLSKAVTEILLDAWVILSEENLKNNQLFSAV
jgi:hypothetical protein